MAPLRLGGLTGKQSTPSIWLGGIGELSTVGKRDAAWRAGRGTERGMSSKESRRQRYDFNWWSIMHFYFRQFNIIDEDIVSACYSYHGFCKTIFLWLCGIDIWVQCYIICLPSYFVGGKMHVSLMGFSCIYPQFILIGCSCVYPQSLLIGFSCACLQFIWLDSVVHAYNFFWLDSVEYAGKFFDWIHLYIPSISVDWIHLCIPQFLLIWFS